MMMALLTYGTLLTCGIEGFAQNGQQNWVTTSYINESVSIFDNNGQPFRNPEDDVSGSSFFLADWKYGRIRLHDSTGYDHIRIRLNLQTQEVHFLNKNNTEMALPKGFVIGIILQDSQAVGGPAAYTFQAGFPSIDNQDRNNFYRVLADGRLELLESIRKVIVTNKNAMSGEEKKEINEYTDYYLFSAGALKKMKKDKAFLLTAMDDKKDKVAAYAADNKLNFKSIDDIGQIIRYYNALP
jgi:hypothetical protein